MGNIEAMMFPLDNAYSSYLALGELNTVEGKIIEILQSSNAPKNRVDKFIKDNRPFLMSARGELSSALKAHQDILNDIQGEGNFQQAVVRKVNMAGDILELNRFGYCKDISYAENILLESIGQDPTNILSQFYLVVAYIRGDRLNQAMDQFAQANENITKTRPGHSFEEVVSIIELEFAFAEKRWTEGISICESLLEIYRISGERWDLARRLIDLGDALVGRDETGDKQRAHDTYQQSLDMFTEMGAPGYIQVLEERLGNM